MTALKPSFRSAKSVNRSGPDRTHEHVVQGTETRTLMLACVRAKLAYTSQATISHQKSGCKNVTLAVIQILPLLVSHGKQG